jgi:hypothetical protein
MPLKTRPETPIERIFREVTGRKMPAPVRRVLLPHSRKAQIQSAALALPTLPHVSEQTRIDSCDITQPSVLALLCGALYAIRKARTLDRVVPASYDRARPQEIDGVGY